MLLMTYVRVNPNSMSRDSKTSLLSTMGILV
nr:MAG TPA: hypothetical protein [Caudoviricetes sp.]